MQDGRIGLGFFEKLRHGGRGVIQDAGLFQQGYPGSVGMLHLLPPDPVQPGRIAGAVQGQEGIPVVRGHEGGPLGRVGIHGRNIQPGRERHLGRGGRFPRAARQQAKPGQQAQNPSLHFLQSAPRKC